MHICLIGLESLSVFMPGFESYRTGGEQVQVSLLAKALVRKGLKVTLVVLDYGQASEIEYAGVSIIKVYSPDEGFPVVRFIYPRIFKLWRALIKVNADVYYTSCAGYIVGLVSFFCKIKSKKSVFRVASDNDCDPKKLLIGLWRDRKIYEYGLKRQHKVLVQSLTQKNSLRKNYNIQGMIAGMFVETTGIYNSLGSRDIDVLWVSNIRGLKRPDLVLILARMLPQYSFHMVGGPIDKDLYDKVLEESKKIDNLNFYGAVSYQKVSNLYGKAKVFINTSDVEGFPNSYLQAWVNGAPTIVFIDPDDCIVENNLGFKAVNVDDMAKIIRELLDSQDSWSRLSKNCVEYMNKNYSNDKILEPYLSAIKE